MSISIYSSTLLLISFLSLISHLYSIYPINLISFLLMNYAILLSMNEASIMIMITYLITFIMIISVMSFIIIHPQIAMLYILMMH
jgi:hypothetical protein